MIGCRRAAFEGSKSNSSVWTRLAASGRLFLFFGFALAGWAGGIPNPKVPRATQVLLVQTPLQLERENVFPKGRFTRELGDASGVSSSVYIFSVVTFLKHFWQPCQKNLKFGMEVAYLEKRCESKFLCSGSKPGELQGVEDRNFSYISSSKNYGFWTLRERSCPFALQLAFGVKKPWFQFQSAGAIRGDLSATF